MRYLLDTNILSEMIRAGHDSRARARLVEVGTPNCCTSAIVACEIAYGVARKASPRLAQAAKNVLSRTSILPLDAAVIDIYGGLRCDLERDGRPIGPHDMLIAAHCLTLGAILVTDNVREFERVASLTVENWLR